MNLNLNSPALQPHANLILYNGNRIPPGGQTSADGL